MSLIDDILKDAEKEIGIEKKADDPNGAPENANNVGGQQDIMSQANSYMQEIEQFKAQLGAQTSENKEVNGDVEPDADDQIDPSQDLNAPGNGQQPGSGGATIQTPGGTVIKLASLVKLAARSIKAEKEEVK